MLYGYLLNWDEKLIHELEFVEGFRLIIGITSQTIFFCLVLFIYFEVSEQIPKNIK